MPPSSVTATALAALVCLGLIVAGAAWIYPPAGLITAGVLGLPAVYLGAYLTRRFARGGGDR